ncbi:MAG TPA: Crp/Fnr family transcriptional regulator [Candidatus Saccharimonadales bacterium]|nr:Crp/Fnr family transcriptional regulator [Candidatus Saccharimonadales bacterium]
MLSAESPSNDLVNLFHQGTRITFNKGEFIIRPGSPPAGVFYISNGLVKAYDITRYGDENLLIIRKSGEILGLTWAITGEDRDIIYAALAPTTVFRIDRDIFRDYLRNHPQAALPLVDMLVDMYRLHSERILNLEYRSVRERLVSFLLTNSKRFGRHTDEGLLIDVPLRHQDIASSISATRETTSRELAALERQGLLASQQSYITLINMEKLRHYLE